MSKYVGSRLRILCALFGESQKAVAAHTGLSQGHLSQVANGARPLTKGVAERVETATGIPAAVFLKKSKLVLQVVNPDYGTFYMPVKDEDLT